MKKLFYAILLMFIVATVLIDAPSQAATYNKYKGPNQTNRVVLTYDDCPDSVEQYKNVVKWAKRNNVGLVIAPTGECVQKIKNSHSINIATYARKRGQYTINHSYSHPDLTTLSKSKIKEQMEKGITANYVRPPFGAWNEKVESVLADMDMKIWLWTVDTNDWRGKSRNEVIKYVINNANKGDTVLMHLQHKGFSVGALKEMKSGLEDRGLKLCRPYKVDGEVSRTPARLPDELPC